MGVFNRNNREVPDDGSIISEWARRMVVPRIYESLGYVARCAEQSNFKAINEPYVGNHIAQVYAKRETRALEAHVYIGTHVATLVAELEPVFGAEAGFLLTQDMGPSTPASYAELPLHEIRIFPL